MKNDLFVVDTNILLSSLFYAHSVPALAFKKARRNGILLISEEVASEYIQVFERKKFDKYVPLNYRMEFIANVITNSLPVVIESPVIACRDSRDDKFLSLAVNGNAHCIISGDADLLVLHPFQDVPILTPADFLNNIE